MKLKAFGLAIVGFLLGLVNAESQVTVYYQPTPYPNSVDSSIHHVVDGWLTNVFYNQSFVRDDRLQVGGWGDVYNAYVKFDLEGLPKSVTQAKLWLKSFPRGDQSTTTPFAFAMVAGSWDENMTWTTQPSIGSLVSFNPGPVGYWWVIDITSWYNAWQGSVGNNGVTFSPWYNDNRFNMFRSSRYATISDRPMLQLTFAQPVTPPNFKMPVPGGISWLVTTEVGGWDCKGNFHDSAHDGSNYFSIDFSWQNKDQGGNRAYILSDDIPILAAANGTVMENAGGLTHPNGFYVVIQHAGGFTTRYLHLKQKPSLTIGQSVSQGDHVGIMGTTGKDSNGNPTSLGVHIHLGIRYNDSGLSSQQALRYVLLDGRLLKSYQTECDNNGNPIRYYLSGNRVYR